jgi:hypothetical protein
MKTPEINPLPTSMENCSCLTLKLINAVAIVSVFPTSFRRKS